MAAINHNPAKELFSESEYCGLVCVSGVAGVFELQTGKEHSNFIASIVFGVI